MSTHYLVDYENVHETGLNGLNRLPAEDCVYVFHTSGNDRISLSLLDDAQAWVKVIRVSPGKQSLDMHLGSFLGYLIGKEEDPETKYAVVSRDTDYHGIAGFWNKSWQTHNKVICIERLNQELLPQDPARISLPPQDDETERIIIHEFIVRAFSKHGVIGSNGLPCMQVSMLCNALNSLPEYKKALKKYSLRPKEYLCTECKDFLMVQKEYNCDWVYLAAEKDTPPEENPEQKAAEEIPDMYMGDLIIDDEPEINESVAEEPAPVEETAMPEKAEEETAVSSLSAIVEKCFQNKENSAKNGHGYIRASFLRDELMQIPEFRTLQKESGLKPIPFIQAYFTDCIRFTREKGIWWAIPAEMESAFQLSPSVFAACSNKIYNDTFSTIQRRLEAAGIEKNAANEITDIFMQSRSAVEPRKVMHNLLIQRFGSKIGSQYYKKAVMYTEL